MKTEVEKIIDEWKKLSIELNKYPPIYVDGIKYLPFQIVYQEGSYILMVDLNIFDKREYKEIPN